MLKHLQRAGLVWPTILAVLGTVILVSLGTWQWQRLNWKNELQARLDQSATAAPVPLRDLLDRADASEVRFRRIKLSGQFRHDLELHYWKPANYGPAWSILTPLLLDQPIANALGRSEPIAAVLVDRGIVTDARKSPDTRKDGQPTGDINIVGRIRLGGVSSIFANPPNPEANQWYAHDLRAMAKYIADQRSEPHLAGGLPQFYVEAESAAQGENAPKPNLQSLELSNRHLSYALTWWGLAATLVGVYAVFAVGRWKRARDI